jgi:hypothetical protein
MRSSTLVDSSLASKYLTRVEVNGSVNTLAYYNTAIITVLKCFAVQAPGPNVIKLFLSVIYEF